MRDAVRRGVIRLSTRVALHRGMGGCNLRISVELAGSTPRLASMGRACGNALAVRFGRAGDEVGGARA